MRFDEDLLGALKDRLSAGLPGLAAQMTMAPEPRLGHKPFGDVGPASARAAVLILLYPRDGQVHLVFIRRATGVLHHRDQIGFPGGQLEGAETIEQAALRETREELGVDPEGVRLIGRLTPLYIPVSDFIVYPVVAAAGGRPDFVPDPVEASEVIEIPLGHLIDEANIRREEWTIRGIPVVVPFYAFGPHKIWGATAMVLAEFLKMVPEMLFPNSQSTKK